MASSYNVSALTNYVDQTSEELITKAVIGNETAAFLTPFPGVKFQKALQLLDVDVIPQDLGCAFTPTGSTTFTQRVMSVSDVNFHIEWCPKDLETKWTQVLLSPGQKYSDADVPAAIIDELMMQVNRRLEVADWNGNTSSGNAYINNYDGLIKLIEADGTYASPTGSGSTAFTEANARTIMKNSLVAIPAALKGDPNFQFYCGYDFFQIYKNKIAADNLFNPPAEGNEWVINIENSPVTMKAVHGLDGTDKIFGFRSSNVFLGMDEIADLGNIELWYSQDDRKVKFALDMKRGVQFAYGSEIVRFSAA